MPEFRAPVSTRPDIIRSIGIDAGAVDATGLPIEEVSCGNAFLLIPVRTRGRRAAEADLAAMKNSERVSRRSRWRLVFHDGAGRSKVTAYSRMFARVQV